MTNNKIRLAESPEFKKYMYNMYVDDSLEDCKNAFLNVDENTFDSVFCDVAWIDGDQVVMHQNLPQFIIDCIKASTQKPIILLT